MSRRPLAGILAAAAGLGVLLWALPSAGPAPADDLSQSRSEGARPALPLIALAAPAASAVPAGPPAAVDTAALLRDLLSRDGAAALPRLEALAVQWPDRALPLYEQLLDRWADLRQHPLALQALARAPLESAAKEALLQRLLARWAEAAPDQAARWALQTPGQAELLAPLQDRWLQQDARSATVFASLLPPGEQRQALLTESLARWTAQDGPGARDWLRSMAPLPELDEAIARHASADELARNAPFEALDLVVRIASPERRWQAWQALARSLHDIDPAQVAPLLAQAPSLSAADRARLLDELQ